MERRIYLVHDPARAHAKAAIDGAPAGAVVTIGTNRTTEQNAAQWPILQAFADQLPWVVNGQAVYMSADEWKDVLTAAFNREQLRVAQGWDGGLVMLGLRTRRFSKQRFSEWIDFLHAAAAERGIAIGETFR